MSKREEKNIIDYVREELKTFDEKGFNDVDSLVLSQLSYTHFNGIVDNTGKWVKLFEVLREECFDGMFSTVLNGEKTKEMLFAMAASPRFRDIELGFYVEETDETIQQQFASVSFKLPFNAVYVAFRGTDSTMIGWKEDFNMAFMQAVPSQEKAVTLLNRVASETKEPLCVGGHSKGGNLAVYAAACCDEKVRERIAAVYNHDGPGFRKDVLQSKGFNGVEHLVKKTVPEFSMIGMLLFHKTAYKVVKSNEKLLFQHDPFSWLVCDGDFIYTDDISSNANILNESVRGWLEQVEYEDREKFIDTLFKIVEASGAYRVNELNEDRYNKITAIIGAFKEVDPQTRKFVFKTANILTSVSVKNITNAAAQAPKRLLANKNEGE